MSTTMYEKQFVFLSLSLTIFHGGKQKGVMCQLTLGNSYVNLTASDMRDIANNLNSIANYSERNLKKLRNNRLKNVLNNT